ncbi:hypothetical protein MKZ38_003525 [Zalerion maritima]|uniref:Uncharacterized protein n=1 Tax=Zalerion maritima TaxID=339359 RepID=A0AAD5WSD5_9PEZI|nr:hypothetical protein MKZ38_003525 [Zalerion maritima]
MAAPTAVSAFAKRSLNSMVRCHSIFMRPTIFCTPVQSYTAARPFSVVHNLRSALKEIKPSPKVDPKKVQTPQFKPIGKPKHKPKHDVPNPKTQTPTKTTLVSGPVAEVANPTPAAGSVAARVSHAYMTKLVAKGNETPLYEAPNHVWFTIGSLFGGAFCIGYAFYNTYFHVMHPPPDIPTWLPYAYGVICATMAGMGMYFFLGPAKIISHIKTIPTTEALLKKAKTKAARESKLLVEVGVRRPILGFEPRKIYVAPSDIYLKKRLTLPIMTISKGELIEIERKLKEKTEKEIKYDKENLMTAPFRQTGRAFRELFRGTKRMMTREGFADVWVNGKLYKLDYLGGWALEDGKAVDRLLAPNEDD